MVLFLVRRLWISIPTCIWLSRSLRWHIHGTLRCIISTRKMLRSCTARFSLVRVSDKETLLARFCSTWRSAPTSKILVNGVRIHHRSKPSLTMARIWSKRLSSRLWLRWLRRNWRNFARGFNQSSLRAWYPRIQPIKVLRWIGRWFPLLRILLT
jgi:hypothetical protein